MFPFQYITNIMEGKYITKIQKRPTGNNFCFCNLLLLTHDRIEETNEFINIEREI